MYAGWRLDPRVLGWVLAGLPVFVFALPSVCGLGLVFASPWSCLCGLGVGFVVLSKSFCRFALNPKTWGCVPIRVRRRIGVHCRARRVEDVVLRLKPWAPRMGP